MRVAVRYYRDNPERPAGIPEGYPWLCVQEDMPEYQEKLDQGWDDMEVEDYEALKASLSDTYNTYAASLPVLAVKIENPEVEALKAQLAALMAAIGGNSG